MKKGIIKKYLTWENVEKLIKVIVKALLKSKGITGAKYDMIISVGRGGLVIARMIAEHLNVKTVQVVDVSSYTDNNEQGSMHIDDSDTTTAMLSAKAGGKNILIVDDCVVTGDTLKVVEKYLSKDCKVANIDSAVLYFDKNNTTTTVTSAGKKYNAQKQWLVFPWEELADK